MMPQRTFLMMLIVVCVTINIIKNVRCGIIANVFNDVNRRLCDDSVFCLDGEGFALRTPAPAGKHSACGNVSLRS